MYAYGDSSIEGLKKTSELAHECNYYSILLVYHSTQSDFWIKCANVLDKNHKFKYHLAIRTYAISPEYFVMMYRAFNEIQKNRIMFNIVGGDIQKSESSIDNIVTDKENFDTSEKRVEYTQLWIKKVLSLLRDDEIPEIVMSGVSAQTLNSAACYADYTLCMVDNYVDNPEKFIRNKNKMVCAAVVIRETYEEAQMIVDNIDHPHQKTWTIFGTEKQVLEKIKSLENIGVTDFLIRGHGNDKKFYLVHDFVKKHNGVI